MVNSPTELKVVNPLQPYKNWFGLLALAIEVGWRPGGLVDSVWRVEFDLRVWI